MSRRSFIRESRVLGFLNQGIGDEFAGCLSNHKSVHQHALQDQKGTPRGPKAGSTLNYKYINDIQIIYKFLPLFLFLILRLTMYMYSEI